MSDCETNKETTIVSEEVSVTKRLEIEEFDDPVIAFDIESRRSGPATVTVVDGLPEDVSPRDLRFHPEYGSEHWVIDDGELVFEREFDPDEKYITVYRLCEAKEEIINSFEDPTVEAESSIEGSEGAGRARGMVRSAGTATGTSNSESVSEPGPGDESESDEGKEIPTLELNDPVVTNGTDDEQSEPAEDRTTRVMTDTASEASESDTENRPKSEPEDDILRDDGDDSLSEDDDDILDERDDGILSEGGDDILDERDDDDGQEAESGMEFESADESLVGALAAELEEGTVPDDDIARLRAALGQRRGEPKSFVVRLEKLQRDVDKVLAYTDALTEFLDENGTGEEVIADFQEEVTDFREEIESFEADLDEVEAATDRTEGRVDDLETEVGDGFEEFHEDMAALREEVDEVRDELEDSEVDERLSKLEENISNLRDWRGRLASVLQDPDE